MIERGADEPSPSRSYVSVSSSKNERARIRDVKDVMAKGGDEEAVLGPFIGQQGKDLKDHPTHRPSSDLGLPKAPLPQYDSDPLHVPVETKFKMDVHTKSYIPEAFASINRLPCILVPSEPLLVQDYHTYIATFAGTSFLDSQPPVTVDQQRIFQQLAPSEQLHPSTYCRHFRACLFEEYVAQENAICSQDMFNVQLKTVDSTNMLYELTVPGLREGIPEVNLGDTIMMRQLILDPRTRLPMRSNIHTNNPEDYRLGFTGLQHMATVYGISKIQERVMLKIEGLCPQLQLHFNVSFQYPERIFSALQRALNFTSNTLDAAYVSLKGNHDSTRLVSTYVNRNQTREPLEEGDWLRHMLLPRVADGIFDGALPNSVFQQNWFDTQVNYEQKVCY